MGNPPCTVLRERPKAPKDLPTHLLNATLEETLASYRQYGYYPSMQVLHTLRTINRAKTQVFERLDALFGARTLQTITDANRPFHTLEHPETLWLRYFTEYLCTHATIVSVIWLHDGIWISPLPAASTLAAANLHASSRLGLPLLDYTVTTLYAPYRKAYATYLHNGTLPPEDPPFVVRPPPPALVPILQERTARDAFMRMMERSAVPTDCIVIDD